LSKIVGYYVKSVIDNSQEREYCVMNGLIMAAEGVA